MSDNSLIKKSIRAAFTSWLQKGEFEKTYEYDARIKNQVSPAFDSICFEMVWMAIQDKPDLQFELLKYNADTEKFGVQFNLDNVVWKDSLFIPLKDAPGFKENKQDIRVLIDDIDWVFIGDQLMPSKVKLVSKPGPFSFRYSKANAREIGFIPSELGFSTVGGQGVQFNYKDYYIKNKPPVMLKMSTVDATINASDDKIFEEVEIEASVNIAQWRRHLENQLVRYIEDAAKSGMTPGNYTVNVRFVIEKDGSITDIRALNDLGYGLAQGAAEILKRGPKWTPGEQNGKKVRSYHTQPITFQVQEQ